MYYDVLKIINLYVKNSCKYAMINVEKIIYED